MQIKEILVSGLFNKYDHKISLDNPENLVLLHGLNGVGKTTILKMIDHFYNGEYFFLVMNPFQKLEINYIDYKITIYSRYFYFARDSIKNPAYIPFLFISDIYRNVAIFEILTKKNTLKVFYYAKDGFHKISPQKEESLSSFPEIKKSVEEGLINKKYLQKMFEDRGIFLYHSDFFLHDSQKFFANVNLQNLILKIESEIKATENERDYLINEDPVDFFNDTEIINNFQEDWEFGSYVENFVDHDIRVEQLNAKLITLREKLAELYSHLEKQKFGDQSSDSQIDSTRLKNEPDILVNIRKNKVHFIHEHRNFQKYKGFFFDDCALNSEQLFESGPIIREQLFNKIPIKDENERILRYNLFKQTIGEYFNNLNIEDDETGNLLFRDKSTDIQIFNWQLSSGEKNLLILFYLTIFPISPGDLVLIDEPEISLHISWQTQIIKTLLEIAKSIPVQYIVSTHSPNIIYDRIDLTVSLS